MMLEIGYLAALKNLGQSGKGNIKVRCIVPSSELASLYENIFAKKMSEGDKRVKFIWQSHASFLEQWTANASSFSKEILMCDEGDLLIKREVSGRSVANWPKAWILLSATPRTSWTKYQELCFQPGKGKIGIYLDASKVFPKSRQDKENKDPSLLPIISDQILKFSI